MRKSAVEKRLNKFVALEKKLENLNTVCRILNFDMETKCATEALEEQAASMTEVSNEINKILKSKEYTKLIKQLFKNKDKIDHIYLKKSIEDKYIELCKIENVSLDKLEKISDTYSKAFGHWQNAKLSNNFKLFRADLENIRSITKDLSQAWKKNKPKYNSLYDEVVQEYEEGISSDKIGQLLGNTVEEILEILEKIKNSKKKIKTDFLHKKVTKDQQEKIAKLVLSTIGFDFTKGSLSESEHPFTDHISRNDARVTTHYYENNFISSLYSCLHEGGHALFMQNCNQNALDNYYDNKSLSQHESVSRFYENVLGKSKEFISFLYPKLKKIVPNILEGVSSQELYEAINAVEPSLIRTEADELTYTLHIYIRFEIEKMLLNDNVKINELPKIWNSLYKKYLGIEPKHDSEGILQDVHWSSGFGYFPTYALGNFCNAMYYNEMCKSIDVKSELKKGKFDKINKWMKNHVYSSADLFDLDAWIFVMTNRELTSADFVQYLKNKYYKIYGIK